MNVFNLNLRALMVLLGALGMFILAEPVFADTSSTSGTELFGEWPAVNVDSKNLNVAPDTLINPGNVNQLVNVDPTNALGMIVFDPTLTALTGVDSTPVVANGIVYVAFGGGKVGAYYANGPQVGQAVAGWTSQQLTDEFGTHDAFDSSPVVTKDAVFIAGRRMHKLDRLTGTELAVHLYNDNTNITNNSVPAGITASQLGVAEDLVLYGTGFNVEAAGGTTGLALYPYAHGEIIAFKQSDLSIAWHIDLSTLDANAKPMKGGQSFGAGMGSFGGFGVDSSRKLVFVGSSNQYSDISQPCFATNTCAVSPLSNALMAINYKNGKVVWYYQFAPNDLWGSAGLDVPQDGKHDFDVHGHPQIFSINLIPGVDLTKIDLVGSRGKDGTYRIFTRDQTSVHASPIAQVQLDPGSTNDGGIQADPAISNDILYIGSTALVEDPSYDAPFIQAIPGYTAGRHTSADIIINSTSGNLAAYPSLSTTIRAIDLRKLILNGIAQLIVGNQLPVCAVSFNMLNPNVDIMGNPTCSGLLPSNVLLWSTALRPFFPLASSGFTYDNGVLIMGNALGFIKLIDASNGTVLNTLVPQPLATWLPGFGFLANFGFQGNLILGGVSAVNGYLYVPLGIAVGHSGTIAPNPLFSQGGLAIYKLQ